jgi:predicted RNA-binding protein (virulence factor B family)
LREETQRIFQNIVPPQGRRNKAIKINLSFSPVDKERMRTDRQILKKYLEDNPSRDFLFRVYITFKI